jgi:hypothetical protein
MRNTNLLFAMMLVLLPIKALADGITIEPGQWEMTTTMTMPMLTEPKVSTVMECMDESEVSPEKMTDEMDSGCTFDARVVEGNTMKWSMDCVADNGSSRGEWEATSHGDTLTGSGTITITMQGQSMDILMEWDGKRVGDCE